MSRQDVVQVAFGEGEVEKVRTSASAAGLSLSAFIRRTIMNQIRIRAWLVLSSHNPAMKVMSLRGKGSSRMNEFYADFFLEPMSESADGGGTYRVFGNNGQPLGASGLALVVTSRELPFGRLMLAGDRYTLWRITRTVEDVNMNGQIVWTLARDNRADTDPDDASTPRDGAIQP